MKKQFFILSYFLFTTSIQAYPTNNKQKIIASHLIIQEIIKPSIKWIINKISNTPWSTRLYWASYSTMPLSYGYSHYYNDQAILERKFNKALKSGDITSANEALLQIESSLNNNQQKDLLLYAIKTTKDDSIYYLQKGYDPHIAPVYTKRKKIIENCMLTISSIPDYFIPKIRTIFSPDEIQAILEKKDAIWQSKYQRLSKKTSHK